MPTTTHRRITHLLHIISVCVVLWASVGETPRRVHAEDPVVRQTVVVTLATAPAPDLGDPNALLRTQRIHSADAQERWLRRRSDFADRVIHRFVMQPVVVLSLSAAEQAALAADPAVVAVRANRLYAPALDASAPIIGSRVTAAAGYAGAGTSVAILDTGVAKAHPMLSGRVVGEACFSSTDASYGGSSLCPAAVPASTASGSGLPCIGLDACNHGTHVAGIVAGKPTLVDGVRLSGVAPATKFIAIQVFSRFDHTHPSRVCGAAAIQDCVLAFESDILAALDYLAAQAGTPAWGTLAAVNLSLSALPSATDCDADTIDGMGLYKTYVDTLRTLGVATVVASGNDGSTAGVGHPACISSAISVGSTQTSKAGWDVVDTVSSFSNAPSAAANAASAGGDRLLDLLAPGSSITAALAAPAGGYGSYSGTSMAAPHVAGAWAVLKGYQPALGVGPALALLQMHGVTVSDTRTGTALDVPRIAVDAALAALRRQVAPVDIAPGGRDFGLVQQGSVVGQRFRLQYRSTATLLSRGTLTAPWRVVSIGCPAVVDDIQTDCVYEVTFAPTASTPVGVYSTALTVVLGGVATKIGLVAEVVADTPVPGMTQTAIAAPTALVLRTRSATPTVTATPLALTPAQTAIAASTRTARRRATQTLARAATRTAIEAAYQTQLAGGGASRTPTPIPTQSPTASALPVTKTIGRLQTATVQRVRAQTETPRVATAVSVARTQTRQAVATAAVATADAAATAGTMSRTPTRTATRLRVTDTQTRTRTQIPRPTLTATVGGFVAVSARTNARYHRMVLRNSGTNAILLHSGDRRKNDPPLVTALRTSDLMSGTGVALIGETATAITSDPHSLDRAYVAGRLDWNSGYIQTISIGTAGIRVVATTVIPLAPGSDIRVLTAVGPRLYVGLAEAPPPSALRVYVAQGSEWVADQLGSVALAGVPATILAVDGRDERIVVAGMVDGAGSDSGFLQLVTTTGGLSAGSAVAAAAPFVAGALAHVYLEAERTVVVTLADGFRIAVYTLGADDLFLWRRADVGGPFSALHSSGNTLVASGYAAADKKNIVRVFHVLADALLLRRSVALTNLVGGIAAVESTAGEFFTLDAARVTRLR